MRYYILFITLAMIAWVANAGISGVGHMQSKALDSEDLPEDSPNASTDALVPEIPPEIANGGQVLPPPAGPVTEAEIKADSALACMEACGGKVDCQNQCIGTTYGVALGTPPPVVTGSVPPPVGSTTTTSAGGAKTTSGMSSAGNARLVEIHQTVGALILVAFASACASF
ncbi:hypothetical protein BGZ70_008790 [Mortierella alpina]|uniref:Uncharacterized protein n=1 Tax=Mortierella alpina TaxID=64518 RepID=A0A9P6J4V5_MORAP|nr:hypothetical protein BGZ70_008790 [Mortierella alpina]